jgi:hypothetical protein
MAEEDQVDEKDFDLEDMGTPLYDALWDELKNNPKDLES